MPKTAPNEIVLPSVRPNASVEVRFRKRLLKLIQQMNRSVSYWLEAQFKETPPEIALDATPAHQLSRMMKGLSRRWQRKFNEAANELAEYYAEDISERSDARLRTILKRNGIAVEFKMTKAQKDIVAATVHESVALIKSIPQKYMTDVSGAVMRSVQVGGDLGQLSKNLQKNYGIAKRRAHVIARDQNAKATTALNRSRQLELGITEAIWKHSHAGEKPRPTHLKNDGKRYDVAKGWYDPAEGREIHPGELINCRCSSRSIIKGFI